MVGLFFLNLFRFLWYSVIVCVVSILLSWIVCLVYEPVAVLYWYLAGVVVAAVGGFILAGGLTHLASEKDDEDHSCEKSVKAILPLFVVLFVAAAAIICFIIYRDTLSQMLLIKDVHTDFGVLTTVLGVYSVFPIIYFLVKIGSYSQYMCFRCGHIFCIGKTLTDTTETNYSEYKTETNRERVGSISAGGRNIADVYGDVSTGYYRNVNKKTKHYNCRCSNCMAKFNSAETEITKGEWK